MSTDLTAMTAAELVTKLAQDKIVKCANHSCYHANPPDLLGDFCEKCGSGLFKKWCYVQEVDPKYLVKVSAEIDARCRRIGLEINSGGDIILHCLTEHPRFSYARGKAIMVAIKNAAEFHALLGYLIAKGGEK